MDTLKVSGSQPDCIMKKKQRLSIVSRGSVEPVYYRQLTPSTYEWAENKEDASRFFNSNIAYARLNAMDVWGAIEYVYEDVNENTIYK